MSVLRWLYREGLKDWLIIFIMEPVVDWEPNLETDCGMTLWEESCLTLSLYSGNLEGLLIMK